MSAYPFQFEDLDKESDEAIKRDFKGHLRSLVRTKPFPHVISREFKNVGEKIYNMEVRPDDVWVVTYPKTGTTWTQAAVWSILNDGNFAVLKENPMINHWRFLEIAAMSKDGIQYCISTNQFPEKAMGMLKNMPDELDKAIEDPRDKPRLIKSHLPLPLLPPTLLDTAKVVYVARNPRDACVSYFHHHKLMKPYGYHEDFENFFDYFVRDLVIQSPYWPHVIDAWNKKNRPNLLFLFYEDMKKDFPAALRKLANFLEKPLSEDMVKYLTEELSIEGMKRNPGVNNEHYKDIGAFNKDGNFIRKGIVGDWKNHFTPEMEKRMDEWSKKQREGSDIKFPGED